jgi:hypothetical protein
MLSLESSMPGGVRGDIRLVAEEESDAAEERDDDDEDAVVDEREKKGIETTGVEDDDVDDDDDDVEDVDVDDCGWAADAADCRAAGTKEEANAPAKVAAEEARDDEEVEEDDDNNNDDAEYDDRSFGAVELWPSPEDDAAGREAAVPALAGLS